MTKRILSIDGGGIRGLIPAILIQNIEEASGVASCATFDMIAGTSTGGIIACGLVAGLPAAQLVHLYEHRGAEIFARSAEHKLDTVDGVLGPKYSGEAIEAILQEILGARWLSDQTRPELVVPSFCCDPYGAWFFQSWKARLDPAYDFRLWEVARATSAAETYFPSAEVHGRAMTPLYMMDGGTHSNNPTMAAITSALELWPGEHLEILSLGTGSMDNVSLPGRETQGWGLAKWGLHIANVCLDGSADTVAKQVKALEGAGLVTCKRVQALLTRSIPLDDTESATIADLRAIAASVLDQV